MKDWQKRIAFAIGIVVIIFIFYSIFSSVDRGPFKLIRLNSKFKSLQKKAELAIKNSELEDAIGYLEELLREFPKHKKIPLVWFDLANIYAKTTHLTKAKEALQKIIFQYPDYPDSTLILKAQKKLGDINIQILFSPIITDDSIVYEVKEGDSLAKIAKRFNTTVDLLKKSNGLKDEKIRPKMKLKVSTAKFSLLIDKSQNTLTLKAGEEVLKVYPVSTGLDNVTPVGTFKIINKVVNPVWYKAGAVVPPDSPENILGSRWLGLSIAGYGIHGTTKPETIGKHITRGCIRMYNPDVEELYTILPLATEVVIVE